MDGVTWHTGRRPSAWPRRCLYFGLVGVTTAAGVLEMADILGANGMTWVELVLLTLFGLTFWWITLSFWSAAIGFVLQLTSRNPLRVAAAVSDLGNRRAPLTTRTAIVMPICNEDPERVIAGLDATYRSLQQTGQAGHFDVFVLSDSRDPAIAAAEERAFRQWQRSCPEPHRIRYRLRKENSGRKAGNIADFCRRWGAQYDFMIVLDADSVMGGETLVRLARMMEASPDVGIIQTLPVIARQETLFGRILQFGSRLGALAVSTGFAFWQQGEGNFFGHNAILRMAPFAEHCRLPTLRGRGPLSGDILSHDFVEAAFMRRAGYKVWMLPDDRGSFEEMPSNLLDYMRRDQRWCRGNLQHLRLLGARGLHGLSRLHLVMGVMAYLTAPLWLLLMVCGIADAVDEAVGGIDYFQDGYTLFPVWPILKTGEALSLFGLTIGMVVAPKLFGIVLALVKPELRAGYGGGGRLTVSAMLEFVASALLAPVMMMFHTNFVLATLLGRRVGWEAQARDGRGIGFREAMRYHIPHILLAGILAAALIPTVPDLLWWTAPVLAGLALGAPLAVMTSRADLGAAARRLGLFLTPEELAAPPELAALARPAEAVRPTAPAGLTKGLLACEPG